MTTDPNRLIHAHIENDLTPEQAAELSAWVELSDANAEHFVRCCVQHYLLREQAVGKDLAESVFSADDTKAEADEDLTRPGLFQYLAHAESPSRHETQPIHIDASAPLTRKTYASALSYVIRHTFTPKRIAVLATAAAVLLGVVLAIVLLTNGPDEPDRFVEVPDPAAQPVGIDDPIDGRPTIVATLTAEYNAAWDRRPGQDLYAGQRFTLTQGFAEITTKRAAVTIIEAPATIELLDNDNDNALRLHTGRLVGIAESESAKGLLIQTPQLDVTDIGTRFSVEVSERGLVEVYVLEGEVKAAHRTDPAATNPTLIAGNAAVFEQGHPIDAFDFEMGDGLHAFGWQSLISRPKVQGEVHLRFGLPKGDGGRLIEADQILAFPERSGFRLPSSLQVTFDQPGEYRAFGRGGATVAAGQVIDSYFLHLDAPGTPDPGAYPYLKGSITFERPILAVIVESGQLKTSHAVLGLPGVAYPKSGSSDPPNFSGLEFAPNDPGLGDVVYLSDDRKTLTLELRAGRAADQLRVITQGEDLDRP